MFEIPTEPTPLHYFIEEHLIALQHAALLLGGQPWLRRVQRLLGELSTEGSLSGHAEKEIAALNALLSSHNASPQARTGTTLKCSVDPASPVFEEISVLANELSQVFQAVRSSHHQRGANEGEGVHV